MEFENKKLDELKANSKNRIIELIQEYCEGSQQQFVDKTGLTKGAVSQYVNGHRTPSNLAAQKIGRTFHVAPAWVMGFDVPKKEIDLHIRAMDSTIEMILENKPIVNSSRITTYSDTIHRLVETAKECTPEQIELAIQVLKNFSDKSK